MKLKNKYSNMKRIYREGHDYQHWLKICHGDKKKAEKAWNENTFGFCCFYSEAMREKR